MKDIIAIVNKLQETSGTNDKVQIIKDNANNETFVKLLKYTYADDKMYGFSDKKLRKKLGFFFNIHLFRCTEPKHIFSPLGNRFNIDEVFDTDVFGNTVSSP